MTMIMTVNEGARKGKASGLNREYTRAFEVRFSDGYGTEVSAVSAVGINVGDAHPDDPYGIAYDATPSQRSDTCFWDVEIQYKTFGRTKAEEERWTVPDPRNRKPKVSGGWETFRIPMPVDRDGNVIRNSAGQVPDPRPECDTDEMTYHVEHAVNPLPDWVDEYRSRGGVINETKFKLQLQNGQNKLIEIGCARLRNVKFGELQIENGFEFFRLSFDILHRESPIEDTTQEDWVYDFVDMGKMAIASTIDASIGITCELLPILGQDGQPVSDPWLLNGEGGPLAPSSGAWSGATAYVAGDVITNDGVDYFCFLGHTNQEPPNATYWRRIPVVRYKNISKLKDFRILPGCSAP